MTDRDHDQEDRELMQRIAQQDAVAYRILLTRHLPRYTRFAERMLGGHNDAKDVMQEVCLKLWNNPKAWQPTSRFSTWWYRVVYNACIDYRRKLRPELYKELDDSLVDDATAQDEIMIRNERSASVRDALQQLPERQRTALVLSYYQEVSNEEAALVMGINLGALQQLLFRARQNLKTLLTTQSISEAAHG